MAVDLILLIFARFFFRVKEGENNFDKREKVSRFKFVLYIVAVVLAVLYALLNLIF